MDTRREFIKKAALLAGAQGFSGVLPASIQKALSIDPRPGTNWPDAEHVVILMQENRSFDHCYGALRGVRGFRDPRAITLPNGNPVWLQTDEKGDTYGPFRLDINGTNATWMGSLPHSWTNQADARNEGRYDQWLQAKHSSQQEYADMPLTLGHYTREDIPFYYAMADAFTVCDQAFCSSLTGTIPNRLHLWTGTIRDEQRPEVRPRVRNEDTDYEAWAAWTSYPERLEDSGISWKIYQNEISLDLAFDEDEDAWLANFGDNPIEFFSPYHVKFSAFYRDALPEKITSLSTQIVALQEQAEATQAGAKDAGGKSLDDIKKELAEKEAMLKILVADRETFTAENYDKLSQREKNLHEKAFCTNKNDPYYHELAGVSYPDGDTTREMKVPRGDVLHQFREDVKGGNLPAVSWLVAPERFSDHPSSAWYGAWYISEAMDILTENPEVWKKTIFILCYDENDGYFDHIPPFVSPRPQRPDTGLASPGIDTALEYMSREQDLQRAPEHEARGGPIGLGYRVPLIIASPWSRGGYVNSQVFDHTSILQFLEKFLDHRFGKKVEETNISNWRRTVCGDLSSVFRPYRGEEIDSLPFPGKDQFLESINKARFRQLPSDYKKLSKEEIDGMRRDLVGSPLMPQQEKGVSPSCALPYELYVDGGVEGDKLQAASDKLQGGEDAGGGEKPDKSATAGDRLFTITMRAGKEAFGDRSAGSPFTIYAYGREFRTRNYAVAAGDALTDHFSLDAFDQGNYDLRVYGPNGFFRAFRGNGAEPAIDIRCTYERNGRGMITGNLVFTLTNLDMNSRHRVLIGDNAYGGGQHNQALDRAGSARSKAIVIRHTAASFGWYDLRVQIEGSPLFEKRYAGRVETGKDSYSDPAMG